MTDLTEAFALAIAHLAIDGGAPAVQRLLMLAADPAALAAAVANATSEEQTFADDDDLPIADDEDDDMPPKKQKKKMFAPWKDLQAGKAHGLSANESPVPEFKNTEDTQDLGWMNAPAASHVKSFRMILRRFEEGTGQPSELWITFRGGRSKKGNVYPESTYCYLSKDHKGLHEIYYELGAVTHPGVTVWEWLIRPGVICHGPFYSAPERMVEGGVWQKTAKPLPNTRPRTWREMIFGR